MLLARRTGLRAHDAGAPRRAADEREPAHEWRLGSAQSRAPRLPRLCRHGRKPGQNVERGDAPTGGLPARRDRAQRDDLSPLRAGRDRLQPPWRRLRDDNAPLARRDTSHRRRARAGRARPRGALRAPLPGLARGVPPDRPPRALQLLRGVHPHHRLDVQPAREVVEDDEGDPVAIADRIADLPAHLARVAAGSQRFLAPGSGFPRTCVVTNRARG